MENITNVVIETQVIKDIVVNSIKEVEEIDGIYDRSSFADLTKKIMGNKNASSSLEVELGGQDCVVSVVIAVYFGHNINEVVKKLSSKIVENINKIAGYNVKELNISVAKLSEPNIEEGVKEENV